MSVWAQCTRMVRVLVCRPGPANMILMLPRRVGSRISVKRPEPLVLAVRAPAAHRHEPCAVAELFANCQPHVCELAVAQRVAR